ncbi:hypothetical protein FJY94_02605 [Candidatus Kaiserbacteria bacterium]|nr:hypothetical protein [Candidatus Kaiserbacteria bacterium]
MQQSAVGSFFQSVIGFLLFISVSLGITYLVNSYATTRDQAMAEEAFQAAALQGMLRQVK